jgi:RelE-like toxin of type II toxin-antitoxin system HigB
MSSIVDCGDSSSVTMLPAFLPLSSIRPATWWRSSRRWKTPGSSGMFRAGEFTQLTGDRQGTWSLTVTRNWRLTCRIDRTEGEILDLDYEDYHGRR